MNLHRTDYSYSDLVGQCVSPVATSAPAASKAMVSVGLHLGAAHTLMWSDKWSTEAESHCYTQLILAQEQTEICCTGAPVAMTLSQGPMRLIDGPG